MNIGNFNRLSYDNCAFEDRTKKSTDALNYRLSIDQIYNGDRGFSTFGPRNSTFGCSTIGDAGYAVSQNMVDVESVLSNRNVKASKCRSSDMVNPINPTTMKGTFAPIASNKLNPEYTRLSHSSKNYRGMGINRFYDTIHDPQANLYWNEARNTVLESKDNFVPQMPQPWSQTTGLPVTSETGYKRCTTQCTSDTTCPKKWNN
jgi:hypothetical protein